MTPAFTIELKLEGQRCVVVGAGTVASRRIRALLEAGAHVHVIAPHSSDDLPQSRNVTLDRRPYRSGDLTGARLAFACTNDPAVNRAVAREAAAAGVWCNVASDAGASNFFVPAMHRQGHLTIAVGTGGASPRLAAALRNRLASQFGPEYAILLEELARARRIAKRRVADRKVRAAVFKTLCTDCSIKLLAQRDRRAWRAWFERILKARIQQSQNHPQKREIWANDDDE